MKKRILGLFLVVIMIMGNSSMVFAGAIEESTPINNVNGTSTVLTTDNTTLNVDTESIDKRGGDADLWAYRKVNVSTSEKWSSFTRVSDNINTYPPGKAGSIVCNKEVSYSGSVSGASFGITINLGKTCKSSIGYTLSVGANKRVYMGYRVYNKIEKGTREKYNKITGDVVERNKYTVTAPQFGEYKLLDY